MEISSEVQSIIKNKMNELESLVLDAIEVQLSEQGCTEQDWESEHQRLTDEAFEIIRGML